MDTQKDSRSDCQILSDALYEVQTRCRLLYAALQFRKDVSEKELAIDDVEAANACRDMIGITQRAFD